MRIERSSLRRLSHHAGETSPLEASPLIRAVGETCSRDGSPGLWINADRPPSQGRCPQWPLAGSSPLPVARQLRIREPDSRIPVSYSVVRNHYGAPSTRSETPASSKVAISLSS